jgi:hypothetical protein
MTTSNKWQKTTMTWDEHPNWTTNITVDDLEGCCPHYIKRMRAISVIDGCDDEARTAVLTFDTVRGVIGPTTRRAEILAKLTSLKEITGYEYFRVSTLDPGSSCKISFRLRRSFCDDVIDFIEHFFNVLGIEDVKKYRLSNFEISSVSMHRQGDGWIPFTQYFKFKNGLQVRNFDVEIMPDTKPLSY